jgi:tRNA A37 threonylcarbamoyltransferase TsaD
MLLIVLLCVWKSDLLVKWGGVAPKMAEEAHALAIDQVLSSFKNMDDLKSNMFVLTVFCVLVLQVVQKALDDANVSETDLSAVAVTIGPGLSLCLRGSCFCYSDLDELLMFKEMSVHQLPNSTFIHAKNKCNL